MLQNGDRQRIGLLGFRLVLVTLAWVMPLTLFAAAGFAADPPLVEQYLQSGKLAEGHDALTARLKDHPDDQQARFGLGVLEFLQAIERLMQSHHRYGLLRDSAQNIPLLRLPVANNPNPETLSYDGFRDILKTFVDDLTAAEKTLAEIGEAQVELPLHFGLIRLDFDGDGTASDEETLWRIYAAVSPGTAQVTTEDASKFVIQFDTGDVYWLRGYCHLLMFFGDVGLGYDGHELFERTGHILWPKNESPYNFLRNGKKVFEFGGNVDIADVVAFIHLINFPVKEPERLTAAHGHLESMIDLSRQSWKSILAETDNEREWVPNPQQTGVIPGVRVSQEMVDGWHLFLTEMSDILDGKKLIPFWRGSGVKGINLKRVFTEPQNFDLVLWIQGTAAAPYLEEGPITSPQVWARLMNVFQGQFIGFAIWFN